MKYCRFYDYANTDSWWSRLESLSEEGWQLQSITLVDASVGRIMIVMQREKVYENRTPKSD